MSILLLVVALVAAVFSLNAIVTRPGRYGPWWFPALFAGELAPFHLAAQAAVGAGFWLRGWAGGWAGWTGLVLLAASAGMLAINHLRALRTKRVVQWAAASAGVPITMPGPRLLRLIRPYPAPPAGVAVRRDVAYGPEPAHRLDLFAPKEPAGVLPVLLQVHGGGWTGGRRDQQARPLMHRMASAGWLVVSISYRLSPRATYPDHLIDVKRAIAWIRRHGPDLGADPSFVAITGGSAGGQLAAVAALTGGRLDYQPGFEAADTSVQACVPLYGVHDLLDKTRTRPKWPYLARYVLKVDPAEDPQRWDDAAPTQLARPDRPPFFIVHGSADTLVTPGESRRLAAALRAAGGPPVGLAEIPGATHGFDAMHSLRAERAVDGIEAVLDHWWRRHRERGAGEA